MREIKYPENQSQKKGTNKKPKTNITMRVMKKTTMWKDKMRAKFIIFSWLWRWRWWSANAWPLITFYNWCCRTTKQIVSCGLLCYHYVVLVLCALWFLSKQQQVLCHIQVAHFLKYIFVYSYHQQQPCHYHCQRWTSLSLSRLPTWSVLFGESTTLSWWICLMFTTTI